MFAWTLWFHIISMVSWFAVLFYLPRLFVYHSEQSDKVQFVEVVEVMEYKIYTYIGVPAFWATLLSGLLLIYLYPTNIFATGGWFHTKVLFVLLLTLYFFSLGWFRKQLIANPTYKSGKFFRMYNEVPTLLMLVIVAMVVVKPF